MHGPFAAAATLGSLRSLDFYVDVVGDVSRAVIVRIAAARSD